MCLVIMIEVYIFVYLNRYRWCYKILKKLLIFWISNFRLIKYLCLLGKGCFYFCLLYSKSVMIVWGVGFVSIVNVVFVGWIYLFFKYVLYVCFVDYFMLVEVL